MINDLLSICEKQKPKEIILLGDIKHNISNTTYHERLDVKNFLKQIKNIGSINITKECVYNSRSLEQVFYFYLIYFFSLKP
jgi:hypothetical protein